MRSFQAGGLRVPRWKELGESLVGDASSTTKEAFAWVDGPIRPSSEHLS
jgi:hypothetical protein